jgi:ATP-dependent Clp protease ATP-binding subunit ClpC
MDDQLAKLVDMARGGVLDLFQQLVNELRARSYKHPEVLIEFVKAPEEICRRAAIQAAAGRTEPVILDAVQGLVNDPIPYVRQSLAYALTDHPSWPLDAAAEMLLTDPDNNVRQAAVWSVRNRPALVASLVKRLHTEDNAWVRGEIANALSDCLLRKVLPDLMTQLEVDTDPGVQQACAYTVEKHLGVNRGYPTDLSMPGLAGLAEIRRRLTAMPAGAFPQLTLFLNGKLAHQVDIEQLAAFGGVLTQEAEAGKLPHAYFVDEAIEAIMGILTGAPPRAAVLVGESGTGKTAVVGELTHRLRTKSDGPWYVLRMSPQDFMANTRYLGEWETRVRNVVNAVKPPRRVVLYVPNIEELAWMGTWEKSEASVASALAPFIERGDVTILGESTVEGFRKGLGANRSLRRLFHAIELQGSDAAETRKILQLVAEEAGAEVSESLLDRIGDLADFFVSGTVQPGRSVGLLRRVLGMTAGKRGPITEQDVLQTISTSTGIPVNFLDDSVALDRDKVRGFFEGRVMGQPEAIDAVVDLVTLVKAGLNDPGKPYGVLLFVGPTGVGKTELARALAEHLFGDPGRLIRLDMSEFATYEAFERLIGQGFRASEPGLLTAAVRERPFSVLLFDEIEKAHPNIYNLCLQIFDAGRLTDTQGRTADFRRTIIILTSNVGSTMSSEGFVGFGRRPANAPDREMTLRELGRWFRPEFLNRLDRIVTFRALAVETAEKIARREVAHVLERSGISRRKLAVDVDPEVLPLLLREGYSPTFGARPLKRTVERMVLLPVAKAIAEGKAPPGSVLRLAASDGRVVIEIDPPEAVDTGVEEPAPAARATPVAQRAAKLLDRVSDLHDKSAPLALRKSELLAQSAAPGFWNNPQASRGLLDEVYRLDGILGALDGLEKKARIEAERAGRHRTSDRDLAKVDERLTALEGEVSHLGFLVSCRESRELGDALLTLRLVNAHGAGLDSVAMLAKMYKALALRRGLEVTVLDDHQGGEPPEDTITLWVTGAGAYALLASEAGLHQVTRGKKEDGPGRRHVERDVVLVEILPAPAGEVAYPADEIRAEVHPVNGVKGRLLSKVKFDVRLFHVPTMTSVHGLSDGNKGEALQRLQLLLRARVDAARQPRPDEGRPPIIRRYRLGPTTLVRDQRSGRHTGRLDQVLEGNLDLFLAPPGRR